MKTVAPKTVKCSVITFGSSPEPESKLLTLYSPKPVIADPWKSNPALTHISKRSLIPQ